MEEEDAGAGKVRGLLLAESAVKDKRSVMVWGAMGLRGKTPLVVIQGNMDAARYRNEILIPHLLPLMNVFFSRTTPHRTARGLPSRGFRQTTLTFCSPGLPLHQI